MSEVNASPGKDGFKTPNAKSINLTTEALLRDDQEEKLDTSVLIPTKSSPAANLPSVEPSENPQIVVRKKRRVQLVADPDDPEQPSKIIPSKSSQRTDSTSSKRIPSLNDISKPALTPPSLNLSYQSFEESTPAALKTSTSSPNYVVDSYLSPIRQEKTSLEILSEEEPGKSILEIRREESKLDSALTATKKKLETLKRAKVILSKKDTTDNEELISKWRDTAQRASNYLLNAAVEKINKAGGKKEYEKKERERNNSRLEYTLDNSFQERISEITNSEEYEALTEEEKESILKDLEDEAEKSMRQFEEEVETEEREHEDDDDEFTMKDLYKKLRLNYSLVFPEQPSSE